MYTRIYGQQQFGKCWCVAGSQPTSKKYFIVKLYSRKLFSYVFCVRKYFYNENIVNYGTSCASMLATAMHSLVVNVKPLISCDEKRPVCLMSRLWVCRGDRMCVSCQDCEYVGETGCKLHTRLTEHKWHFSNLTAQLLLNTMDHRIDFSEAPCWLQKTTSYGEVRLRYFTSTNRTTSSNCSLESIRKTHLHQ